MNARRLPAAAAAFALGAAAALVPVSVPAASADAGTVQLVLAANAGVLRPGEDLVVEATVSNLGSTPVAPSTLSLAVSEDTLDRGELVAALADPSSTDTDPVGEIGVPALTAGATATLGFTVPAANVGQLLEGSGWGAHVVAGSLGSAGTALASGTAGFAWLEGEGPQQLGVTTIMPLTTPAVSDGLLDAESLGAYTSAGGALRKKLDAAVATGSALALDPRVIASIRALGSNAPATAVEWLDELRTAPNPIFPLGYADADLALERRAGAPSLFAPTSFQESLDPADFTAGDAGTLPSPTASPSATTPGPTATPTPSATPGALPTTEELLSWDYTATDLAWPTSVHAGDAGFYAASGLTRTIVPSANLADGGAGATSGVLEGSPALVEDSALSDAVSEAAFSGNDAAGRHALADAVALLAATAEGAAPGSSVIIGLSRSWPAATDTTLSVLQAVTTLGWTKSLPLDQIPTTSAPLTLAGDPADDFRLGVAQQLVGDMAAVDAFSSVLADPAVLVARERLRLLPLLSVQWVDFADAWNTAAGELHTTYDSVLNSVSISNPSPIVALGAFDSVPVYVANELDLPVTINLDGRPSNGRLLVEPATVTIAAQSSQRILLPARSIANGQVTLFLDLTSPTGVAVGSPASLTLDVQAEWETAGIIAVSTLVALLFGFGLFRNIRRRRRERGTGTAG